MSFLTGIGPVIAKRLCDELLAGKPSLSELPRRWREADMPAPAREPGQLLLDTLASATGVASRVEHLKRTLAPLIRSAYSSRRHDRRDVRDQLVVVDRFDEPRRRLAYAPQ
jgi:hypothetical protein